MKLTFYVIVDTTKKQEFLKGGVPVSAIVYFSREITPEKVVELYKKRGKRCPVRLR